MPDVALSVQRVGQTLRIQAEEEFTIHVINPDGPDGFKFESIESVDAV